MTIWDHTGDALLYCYCWHRIFNRATVNDFIPDALRFIVGYDDTEDDRYPYYGKARNNMYLRYWLPMVGATAPKRKAEDTSPKKTVVPQSVMQTQAVQPPP